MSLPPIPSPLSGVVPPVLTPLRDGRPDPDGLRRLLDRTWTAGCPTLFVAGTAGLGPLLTDGDWERVVETAAAWADGRAPLLAGVMETSTPRAIARIRILERLGYRGYVLTPTFYLPPRDAAGFLRHFALCKEAVPGLEQVIYNIPSCTGCAIPPEVLAACAARGICRSVKDSSGDCAGFAALCALGRDHGFSVLQGNRPDLAWLRAVGAAGLVPVPSNLAPAAFVAAWHDVGSGDDLSRAQAEVDRWWTLLVEGGDWIAGTAAALAAQGIGDGSALPPLAACAPERRARILAALEAA